MIFIVEIDARPVQWKPGRFKSRVMTRYWWIVVAVSILHIPLKELAEKEYDWRFPVR